MSVASAIYVRVPRDLLQEFDKAAQLHGLSRSEAIREAMKLYIRFAKAPEVKKLRGIAEADVSPEDIDKFVLPG